MSALLSLLIGIVYVIIGIIVLILLIGIRFIPNNRIGLVEKRFGGKGRSSPG